MIVMHKSYLSLVRAECHCKMQMNFSFLGRFESVTGSPPSTSESVDSDVFDLSSSPLNNVGSQEKERQNRHVQIADGKLEELRGGSTSSEQDFSLKPDEGESLYHEEDTARVKMTNALLTMGLKRGEGGAISSDVGDNGDGGSLRIPGCSVDAEQNSRCSPPSSCDSGVVMDESIASDANLDVLSKSRGDDAGVPGDHLRDDNMSTS